MASTKRKLSNTNSGVVDYEEIQSSSSPPNKRSKAYNQSQPYEKQLNLLSDSEEESNKSFEKNNEFQPSDHCTDVDGDDDDDDDIVQQSKGMKRKSDSSESVNDDNYNRSNQNTVPDPDENKHNEPSTYNISQSYIRSDIVNDRNKNDKRDDSNQKGENSEQPVKFASIVAAYYNSVEDNATDRQASKIFYLRNFNNWIKTFLIDDCVSSLRADDYYRTFTVLDMCCGKGGDIIKWLKAKVKHIVMTDIAAVSLEQCKERFSTLSKKFASNSDIKHEVILADCTRTRLRPKYEDPSMRFDIVSCQFSFHYCFESLPQAECMLKNAAECLKPGGYFIGTLPNAYEIVKRLKKHGKSFGNDIFSLKMISPEPYSLFGAKYEFKLEGVVDCPEFLVHFPTFVKLARRFGLKLVSKRTFDELYEEKKKTRKGSGLLRRMSALETYPPHEGVTLNAPLEDYSHARCIYEMRGGENGARIGTLSRSEWEVITLYNTFIFEKQKTDNF